MTKLPLHPKHPERICWGCDRLCSAENLLCGNGTVRTQHPAEIFGDDWAEWLAARHRAPTNAAESKPAELAILDNL